MKMSCSTRSHLDGVRLMTKTGSALRDSHELGFEMLKNDEQGSIQISAWEAKLDEKPQKAAGVAIDVREKAPIKLQNHHIGSRCTHDEDVIAQEVKSAVKGMITTEWSSKIKEPLGDILRTSCHNSQSGIRSVVENVMLDLIHKEIIGETLDSYIANFCDTNAAAELLSKRLLASSSFMNAIATFPGVKRIQKWKRSSTVSLLRRTS